MTTYQGLLVRVDDGKRFLELANRYRIVVADPSGPWLLIDVEPRLRRLGPPAFAQALSKELNTSVIAFFLQSTVSTERIEHWENGELVRELEYTLEGGGWIAQRGAVKPWEGAYFFSEEEGTTDGEDWPRNLSDEISPADLVRYENARAKRAAEPVMDLLRGGSIHRLCEFYGVDPKRPGAQYKWPPNWRLWTIVTVVLLFFAGAVFLRATRR